MVLAPVVFPYNSDGHERMHDSLEHAKYHGRIHSKRSITILRVYARAVSFAFAQIESICSLILATSSLLPVFVRDKCKIEEYVRYSSVLVVSESSPVIIPVFLQSLDDDTR